MPTEYFFPKAFYYEDGIVTEEENNNLIEAANQLVNEFPESTRSNLYTTYGSLPNILERKEFTKLRDAIVSHVNTFLNILETGQGNKYSITDSWVSISSPGNFERMHTHDGAYISGVYYINTLPNCGNLYFEELSDNLWASARSKKEHYNTVSYAPVERRVILFNSKVPHYVGQNESSGKRVALSFNIAIL